MLKEKKLYITNDYNIKIYKASYLEEDYNLIRQKITMTLSSTNKEQFLNSLDQSLAADILKLQSLTDYILDKKYISYINTYIDMFKFNFIEKYDIKKNREKYLERMAQDKIIFDSDEYFINCYLEEIKLQDEYNLIKDIGINNHKVLSYFDNYHHFN